MIFFGFFCFFWFFSVVVLVDGPSTTSERAAREGEGGGVLHTHGQQTPERHRKEKLTFVL